MNTKINNWFIIPDYKSKYGIYSEFNSFESYNELIKSVEVCYYCRGYAYDERTYYLSNSGHLPGDIRGRFTSYDELISSFLKQPFKQSESEKRNRANFIDLSEKVIYDMDLYTINQFYPGDGDGCGRGYINGDGDDQMWRR